MFPLFIGIHIVICVFLIIVVLMQSSKGEGLAGAFGGGALSGAVFGGRGAASFLSKATTILAIFFMVSCLGLSLMSAGGRSTDEEGASAVTKAAQQEQQQQQQQAAQEAAGQPTEGATPEDIFQDQPGDTK